MRRQPSYCGADGTQPEQFFECVDQRSGCRALGHQAREGEITDYTDFALLGDFHERHAGSKTASCRCLRSRILLIAPHILT